MISIYRRMKELLPSLNRRRITWRMLERAVKKLKALLYCVPLSLDGYYIPANLSLSGKPEIYVNSNLSEDLQIATATHELKHTALDYPIEHILFSFRGEWTQAARRKFEEHNRYEYEACAMGALALLPLKKLDHASRGLFDVEDEFLDDVWSIRLHLRENHGI